jgi:hypothetical protein
MRIYLILDSEGNIAGTLGADVQQTRSLPQTDELLKDVETRHTDEGTVYTLRPPALRGQTVYEVELPSELEELYRDPMRATELHESLMRYDVVAEAKITELVLRESAGETPAGSSNDAAST